MKRHKNRRLVALCVLSVLFILWVYTGGIVIRKIEGYHFDRPGVSDTEIIRFGIRGMTHTDFDIPFLFRYVKSVRPFKISLRYECDKKLYDEISINSVSLNGHGRIKLPLSEDQLPVTVKFVKIGWETSFSYHAYHPFKTQLDIPFEDISRIDFVIDMTLKSGEQTKEYRHEGTFRREHVDEITRYWDEFNI